jgi:hypothetical protein
VPPSRSGELDLQQVLNVPDHCLVEGAPVEPGRVVGGRHVRADHVGREWAEEREMPSTVDDPMDDESTIRAFEHDPRMPGRRVLVL